MDITNLLKFTLLGISFIVLVVGLALMFGQYAFGQSADLKFELK